MSAGFASLKYLKSQLLPEALREDTSYDAQLTALGLGVAAQIEKFCARKFGRVVGDTEIFPADRIEFLLSRFPVEAVSASHVKNNDTDGWVEQAAGFIVITDLKNGIINTGVEPGPYYALVKFTTTGGYWIDTSDLRDGTLPTGATALPDDLLLAWLLQCKKVWEVADPMGTKLVPSKESVQLVGLSLAGLDLVPQVAALLGRHVRYQMT